MIIKNLLRFIKKPKIIISFIFIAFYLIFSNLHLIYLIMRISQIFPNEVRVISTILVSSISTTAIYFIASLIFSTFVIYIKLYNKHNIQLVNLFNYVVYSTIPLSIVNLILSIAIFLQFKEVRIDGLNFIEVSILFSGISELVSNNVLFSVTKIAGIVVSIILLILIIREYIKNLKAISYE